MLTRIATKLMNFWARIIFLSLLAVLSVQAYCSNAEVSKDQPTMNIDNLELIREGDPYEEVIDKIGKPSSDDLMYKKHNNELVGRRLLYILEQTDLEQFNAGRDKYIELFLDENDLLIKIVETNRVRHD